MKRVSLILKKNHGRCPDEFFSLTIQIIFSKLTNLSRSVLSFSKCFKQNVTKKKVNFWNCFKDRAGFETNFERVGLCYCMSKNNKMEGDLDSHAPLGPFCISFHFLINEFISTEKTDISLQRPWDFFRFRYILICKPYDFWLKPFL